MRTFWLAFAILAAALCAPRPGWSADGAVTQRFGGRDMIVFAPSHLPPAGHRALVVVLHGGLGNAARIEGTRSESALNMDAMAEQNGFIVAYLNGTPVTRRLGPDMLGWNAGGGCCGMSAENDIDDVGYIQAAVAHLEQTYGIDPGQVFGMGHSNGAMMSQRLMCETGLYSAIIAISGPLNAPDTACPAARGKRILAIHGQDDANVPIGGGRGSKGLSEAIYASENHSRQIFTASGASYDLQIVGGADHKLDNIDAAIKRTEGRSIPQKAVAFFELNRVDR